jgi:hypothetical protein
MIDYSALLYEPVYAVIGVPAVFAVASGGMDTASAGAADGPAIIYEPQYVIQGWFDDQASRIGWFDEELQGQLSFQAAITVIDDTRPKVLPVSAGTQAAEVRSVGPGAFARIPELECKGIARADYAFGVLAFNGRTWIVRSWELRGSPNGEDFGEVRFLLKEATPR